MQSIIPNAGNTTHRLGNVLGKTACLLAQQQPGGRCNGGSRLVQEKQVKQVGDLWRPESGKGRWMEGQLVVPARASQQACLGMWLRG